MRAVTRRGSAALELALLTPIALLVMDLAVAGGRLTDGQSKVDQAAYAGARAASQAHTSSQARAAAERMVGATLAGDGASCASHDVAVDVTGFHPGGAVSVDVTCYASLRDVSLLPLPGTHAVHARATSGIDVYGGAK